MSQWECEWCAVSFKARGTAPRRFCCRAHADEWSRRGRPTDAWLRQKYIEDQLTANDIAALVSRDPKRVWEWLKQAGIPTRPRGSYNTYALSGATESPLKGRSHTPESIARITEGRRKVPDSAYANNGHYLRGRPGSVHPNWKGGHTPDRQAFYATPEWKATARAVWVRDRATCQRCVCKPPRKGPKHNRGHIHHLLTFANEATRMSMDNLILLCAPCHRWVHSNANAEKDYIT